MAAGHDNGPGVWPGFVAAFTGLVLSLLIMGMVMGISVYVLGQLPSLDRNKPVHGPEHRQEAAPAPSPPPARAAAPLQVPPPAPRSVDPVRPVATIDFDGNAVQMPRSAAHDLAETLRQATAAGVRHWRIDIFTDEQDLGRQRAAFMRLMAVRNVLLSASVPAADIETRLVDSGPPPTGSAPVDRMLVYPVARRNNP